MSYRKYGNLLIADGFLPYDPKIWPEFQDEDFFMNRVWPEWIHKGTRDPLICGVVWPGFFEKPLGEEHGIMWRRRIHIVTETKISLTMP